MKKTLLTISIITTTYNSDLLLFEKVLKSISNQDYPKKKVEHVVADPGSTNGTLQLARSYGCKILLRRKLKEEINARMFEAIEKSKNDIIAIIESDNPLPTSDWLRRMVEPFSEKNVFSTFNMYNCTEKDMSLLSRYCALFGVSDPVLFYLKKSEKLPRHQTNYNKGKIIKKNKNYTIVNFDKKSLPTLGDNGCLILRKAFNKTTMNAPTFIHLDLFQELLDYGFNTFGAVNNCIVHSTGSNIRTLIKRRLLFRKIFFEKRATSRKYLVFDSRSSQDKINLLKFCFFTVTFVEPLYQSVRGYIKVRDVAWFLHPIMCWVFFIGYLQLEIKKILAK